MRAFSPFLIIITNYDYGILCLVWYTTAPVLKQTYSMWIFLARKNCK